MKIEFKTYLKSAGIIILIGILVFLFFMGLEGYHWFQSWKDTNIQRELISLETARQQLKITENQARAGTQVVSNNDPIWKKEIEVLKKDNAAMMAIIKQNNEEVKNIGTITASVNEKLSLSLKEGSDHEYKAGTGDPNEQYFKIIEASEKDSEGKEITLPWAWSIYLPNRSEEERWKTGLYPIEFKTKIIQTEQRDGQWNSYVEAWAENNQSEKYKGIKLPLSVKGEFIQIKRTDSEFYPWAPHINLNLNASNLNVGGGISLSLSGYGLTSNDLSWQFLSLGAGTDGDDYWIHFEPVSYNIGRHIPLIENTFISPLIGYDFKNRYFFGVNLSVPF